MAKLLAADVYSLCGNREKAAECIRQAIRGYERENFQMQSLLSQVRLGQVLRNDDGRRMEAGAAEKLHERGVVDPHALSSAIVPVMPELTS